MQYGSFKRLHIFTGTTQCINTWICLSEHLKMDYRFLTFAFLYVGKLLYFTLRLAILYAIFTLENQHL